MHLKTIALRELIADGKYELPHNYRQAQKVLRSQLKAALHRTNGTITAAQFQSAFAGFKDLERLKQRLFQVQPDSLEWKREIVTADDLAKKLGGKSKITKEIAALFRSSKEIRNRTRYSHLTPSNRLAAVESGYSFHGPVYGFDILIRPITRFNSESNDRKNDLHIGSLSFAAVIHAELDDTGIIKKRW